MPFPDLSFADVSSAVVRQVIKTRYTYFLHFEKKNLEGWFIRLMLWFDYLWFTGLIGFLFCWFNRKTETNY